MIKLYYNTNLRVEADSYQLFPLLEVLEKPNSPLSQYYQLVDTAEACDFGIVPMNLQLLYIRGKKNLVDSFIATCKKYSKKVLVFSGGDFGVTISNEDVITIRLGGFHSKLPQSTYIMPPFINDPYQVLKQDFSVLQKEAKPTIGFVGHSNGSFKKLLKEYMLHYKGKLNRFLRKDVTDAQFFYPSSLKRHKYLQELLKNKKVDGNFIFRNQYRAGVKTEAEKQQTTQEFYKNIEENLYTFCLRGTGNFSVRFYETLAMGRIPVVVDTDCRLPFSEIIDWEKHCVIIPETEVNTLAEKLIDFHNSQTHESLVQIQKKNRMIWQNYLTKDSYFQKLASLLKN